LALGWLAMHRFPLSHEAMSGLVHCGHLPSLINQTLIRPYEDLGPELNHSKNIKQTCHK